MAIRNVFMKNFPVVTCKAYEGTLTRVTTSVSPTGGVNEGAAYYSAPIAKGDLINIFTHTETDGNIIVQKQIAANDADVAFGIAVSEPFGIDNATTTGGTPTKAYRRNVDVAFFGLGIIELVASASGAVTSGASLALDEDEQNEVEVDVAVASLTKADNGSMFALTYAAAGNKVAVLIAGSVCFPAD
jgi:hypothetical protein